MKRVCLQLSNLKRHNLHRHRLQGHDLHQGDMMAMFPRGLSMRRLARKIGDSVVRVHNRNVSVCAVALMLVLQQQMEVQPCP